VLLRHWRQQRAHHLAAREEGEAPPIFHVRHISVHPTSPLYTGTPGTAFMPQVIPNADEIQLEKCVNSSFIGTTLEQQLRALRVTQVVIAGLTTPHCISTTSRMASNLGFKTTLVHDACAAFTTCVQHDWNPAANSVPHPPNTSATASAIHNSAIDHLHGEFVTARSTAEVLLSWDAEFGGRPHQPVLL
jgi:hypothetical protein